MGKSDVKSPSLTRKLHRILFNSRTGEETGIPGVAVKCVDIRRNANGEGKSLDSS